MTGDGDNYRNLEYVENDFTINSHIKNKHNETLITENGTIYEQNKTNTSIENNEYDQNHNTLLRAFFMN